MRIAVIGTGHIGSALGAKWLAAGHEVVYGSRQASGEGPGDAPVRAVGDALAAEVVVLALPGGAVPDLVTAHGPALAGTIMIDAANRIGGPEFSNGDADATPIVDSLLPLWMALVREQGGNRKLALRVLTG